MTHVRTTALLCACALAATVVVDAAPALPARSDRKGSKMVQEETIVVKRLPNAYFYPFSLWPIPKFPVRDREEILDARFHRRVSNVKRHKQR